jgi:hypothetical protein
MTIWLVTAVVIQTSDGPGYLTLYHRNRPQTTYVLDFIGIGGCQFEHSSIADRVKPSRYPELRSLRLSPKKVEGDIPPQP